MEEGNADHETNKNHPVTISVNNRPVNLRDKKVTGLQIKEAAIAQGVAIQLDFKLFQLKGNSQHPVLDGDRLTVHERDQFRAVAADDNS